MNPWQRSVSRKKKHHKIQHAFAFNVSIENTYLRHMRTTILILSFSICLRVSRNKTQTSCLESGLVIFVVDDTHNKSLSEVHTCFSIEMKGNYFLEKQFWYILWCGSKGRYKTVFYLVKEFSSAIVGNFFLKFYRGTTNNKKNYRKKRVSGYAMTEKEIVAQRIMIGPRYKPKTKETRDKLAIVVAGHSLSFNELLCNKK